MRVAHPDALFTFTGHSLGGAVADIIGASTGVPVISFNSPGTRNVISPGQRQAIADITGTLTPSSLTSESIRLYGDVVSLAGTHETLVKTVRTDHDADLQQQVPGICIDVCHKMALMTKDLAAGATIQDGLVAPLGNAIVHYPVADTIGLLSKVFNVFVDKNIWNIAEPPLRGNILYIDMLGSDVALNGITVAGDLGATFDLQGLSSTGWTDLGLLTSFTPADVAAFRQYRILGANGFVDEFGEYAIGLRFDRAGTFAGSLGDGPAADTVPEPELWAMFIAGLFAVGVVNRKDRARNIG